MDEMLGYLCNDVARHGREISRIERALTRQRGVNRLVALFIIGCICRLAMINRKLKELEADTEGESD